MLNTKTDQAAKGAFEETVERTRAEMRQNLKEQFARDAFTVAKDGAMDVTAEMQRLGRPMLPAELERKLLKCNGRLRFQVSHRDPTKKGIYSLESTAQIDGTFKSDLRFICGFENRLMPEYSIIVPMEKKLPDPDDPQLQTVQTMDEEIRGWRTVLASCLIAGILSPADVMKHFPIEEGKSEHWHNRINPDIEVQTNGIFDRRTRIGSEDEAGSGTGHQFGTQGVGTAPDARPNEEAPAGGSGGA